MTTPRSDTPAPISHPLPEGTQVRLARDLTDDLAPR